ncbi:hypothetical protein NH26_02235 [Flammeovirga pacifica]|uniref:Peptidase n=2 Tax=Flammeovirga pacifica TaxID=915059 RepID=A0A1S1Z549_FLAPC|nr:hypothetical protein NH26_02235 [Flammeovirga pacifica]
MTKEEQEDLSLYGYDTSDTFIEFDQKTIDTRILQHITKGKEYTSGKKYSDRFMIMVDMGIHSGKNRMFVYDLNQKKVIKKMLVSHGCGDHTWGVDYTRNNPKFSNVPNSHLSSLGKYKIGKRGYSNWGINVNYKLHGLDATNNNAFRRVVVLHSWNDVTDEEVYPDGAVEGYGCPAVSNNNMKYLDSLLKKEDKAVLMWIYQ